MVWGVFLCVQPIDRPLIPAAWSKVMDDAGKGLSNTPTPNSCQTVWLSRERIGVQIERVTICSTKAQKIASLLADRAANFIQLPSEDSEREDCDWEEF